MNGCIRSAIGRALWAATHYSDPGPAMQPKTEGEMGHLGLTDLHSGDQWVYIIW